MSSHDMALDSHVHCHYFSGMRKIITPELCTNMEDVRAGVDALDVRIVALLGYRFAYMRAAARIKPDRTHVRDEARKAQVIEQVKTQATQLDLPADVIAEMWEGLVEASIAYEMAEFDRIRSQD